MPNISLILITKNVNELIFVDDNSTDNTIEIAKSLVTKSLTVKTFNRGLDNDFSAQRQFAISKCKNDWILWLDADETPSIKLIDFINNIDSNQYYNYAFKRNDIFLGHQLQHGETSSQYFLRLFNKKFGQFTGKVHEFWSSPKPTQNINFPIIHQSHSNLTSFFEKINYYSQIRAQELFDQKTKTSLLQIIAYPKAKFIQNYFLRLGFLDGTPGIIMALGMSFHSFLVRSKLWCLQNH
jgi:glycosyltransferase involved in cell wall biosynthesis